MSERILITSSDPEGLARAVEARTQEPFSWCRLDGPGFAQATIWFCAGAPPESPLRLPKLRWIQSGWAGVDHWVDRPEWSDGVELTRTIGDFPRRIAQHVLGYLLAHSLRVDTAFREMQERTWKKWTPGSLEGKSLLVAGMGAIGSEVAAAARAFGMEVFGVRRTLAGPTDPGISGVNDLPQILKRADVVVNLLPLTPETESFWTAERFGSMKQGATFVNVSRGRTVDEGALLKGLGRGRPGFAILDVFREEPLPADHPLRGREDVWISPHVAGISAPEPLALEFAENLRRFRAGERLLHRVDRARGY